MATDIFGLEGQILDGQFRVEKAVGEGGFSVVYRGRHMGLDEPIAIKCLKLAQSLGPSVIDSFVRRFRDESKLQYKLSQGNLSIVRAIASGTSMAPATGALVPYMVLEWLDGMTLEADFENRHGRGLTGRSLEEMMALLDSGAEAVAFAHTQGVIHRDLNPGNFFIVKPQGRSASGPVSSVRETTRLKVLDFGVAKVVSDHAMELGPRAQTLGFIRIFSPAYGAPEQFQDSLGKMGPWTDVYTFAMIALEALCDAQPYEGANIGEYAAHALNPKVRPTPRTLGLSVSDEIEGVFARALALKPEDRFHDLGEFWGSLKSVVKISREKISFAAARQTPSLAMPSGDDEEDVTAVKNAGEIQALLERVSKNFGHASDLKATTVAEPPDTYREDEPTAEEPDTTVSQKMPELSAQPRMNAGAAKTLAFSSPTPSPAAPAVKTNPAPAASPIDPPSDITPMVLKSQAALFRTLAFSEAPRDSASAKDPASRDFPAPPPVLYSEPAPAVRRATPDPTTSPVAFPPQQPAPQLQASPAPTSAPMQGPPSASGAVAQTMALGMNGPPSGSVSGAFAPGPAATGPHPQGSPMSAAHTLALSGGGAPYAPAAPGMNAPPSHPQQMAGSAQYPAMSPPSFPQPGPHGPPHGSGYGSAAAAAGYAVPQQQHHPQPAAPPQGYGPPQGASGQYPGVHSQQAAQPGGDEHASPPPERKGKTLVVGSIVAIFMLLVLAGGLVVFLKRGDNHPKVAPSAEASTASPSASATAPVATAPSDVLPTAAPTAAASDPAPTASPQPDPVPSAAPTAPAQVASAQKPGSTPGAPTPVPTAAPTATASSKFDAKAANAAASKWGVMAASCKEKDGIGGPGTASVTFAPSGDVTSVTIDAPYAGTTEGACVQRWLTRSKMAAYEGDPGTIRYRFSLPK